jgi:pimeloyl-ACP methyl ester carboxylesterase
MSNTIVPSRLLFLPGALGNRDFWQPLAGELRFHADRVFLVYPGFANVPADPSITSFDDLVEMVVSRIDCPTALIAQSMGGVLAIEAAIRKQSLITHLVLVATSGGLDTSKLGAVNWRQTFEQDHPDLPNWFTSFNTDLTSELSGIDVPVLLLWGDCDLISPIGVGKALVNHLPNATLHVVPGGQHDLARVHAQSIAPLIDAHLQSRRAF